MREFDTNDQTEPVPDYKEDIIFEQTMSPEIGELVEALAQAQGEIVGAAKGSENPFFKSRYADLAQVWEACREPLSKHGIAVIQIPQPHPDMVSLLTLVAHKSGQWIKGRLDMRPNKSDPQGIGSCLTYARRYALAAMIGVAQIDDDGEGAMNRGTVQGKPVNQDRVMRAANKIKQLIDEEDEGTMRDNCRKVDAALSNDERVQVADLLKKEKPDGSRKTYVSIYNEWLKVPDEANP